MNDSTLVVKTSAHSLFQPSKAAFWVFCLGLLGGVYATYNMTVSGLSVVPVTVAGALLAWVLYTLPMLWLFRLLGILQQETFKAFAMAFAWGGLAAVYLAIPANQAVIAMMAKVLSPEIGLTWAAAVAGPSDEEPLKLLGVILLILIAPARFKTISSVMAIGAMVGLGFQVVENYSYTVNVALNYSSTNQVEPVVQMLIVRGVFCGLWSHAAYTAIASFGVGYFVVRQDKSMAQRLAVAVLAFVAAWSLHSFWNSPLLAGDSTNILLTLLYLPLKGAPVLLAALLLRYVAKRDRLQTQNNSR
ncbi:MAG TPA: PrsW family glutamic-type intramembrane protease [Burkholderiaceae bacterium]|nr:PrsW family glutamic-type intramembrane protease [Burkholderiaceae bacterium]